MLAKRRSFNPKQQTNLNFTQVQRLALAERVGYGGNPEHKRHPGDFGLLPPSVPRPDKTLCDLVGMFSHQVALDLLREGIRKGLVSAQMRGEFPRIFGQFLIGAIPWKHNWKMSRRERIMVTLCRSQTLSAKWFWNTGGKPYD